MIRHYHIRKAILVQKASAGEKKKKSVLLNLHYLKNQGEETATQAQWIQFLPRTLRLEKEGVCGRVGLSVTAVFSLVMEIK